MPFFINFTTDYCYYRLSVFPVNNLPLRERKEDIPLLAQYFIHKHSEKIGKRVSKISAESVDKLMCYAFPGNIRELENIIERSIILSKSKILELDHWEIRSDVQPSGQVTALADVQRDHIVKILKECNWKVSGMGGAAELLGVNSKTLNSKMKKLGIYRSDYMLK
ncbi:MAG: helix-turn-helix domain-containing protein [Bacteroidota bacterium]